MHQQLGLVFFALLEIEFSYFQIVFMFCSKLYIISFQSHFSDLLIFAVPLAARIILSHLNVQRWHSGLELSGANVFIT